MQSVQASVAVSWELGSYTVSSLTSYTDWDESVNHDVDFHPGNVAGNLEKDDFDQWSQELRLASNFDGRFNFVAGIYYEEQDGRFAFTDTVVDGSLFSVSFGSCPKRSRNSAANRPRWLYPLRRAIVVTQSPEECAVTRSR